MAKFIYSFGLIFCGVALGYAVQIFVKQGFLRLPIPLNNLRKLLQKIALLFFMPITVLGAIWIINIKAASIAALPFFGFTAITMGGILAWGAARILRLEPYKTGAFIPCGAFTNIGSIGALVCFIFLGEKGFALVPIYKIFEELSYYAVGFPVAKYYSRANQKTGNNFDRLKSLARDPFILVALASIAIGATLNLSGIPRPAYFKIINSVFIPVGTTLLLVSIGLAMRFRSVRNYYRECVTISLIKFLIVPVCMTCVGYLIGYGAIDNGLPLKVVMILSAMPVAFNALIPPSIFDLDLDLANSCWFFTTSLLIIVLPVLLFLTSAF